jgi:hypothetical protein
MAQKHKPTRSKAADDTAVSAPVTNAHPNYYDTQVMFSGYPGSKTFSGTLRRSGRPIDPVLDDLDDIDDGSDLTTLIDLHHSTDKD